MSGPRRLDWNQPAPADLFDHLTPPTKEPTMPDAALPTTGIDVRHHPLSGDWTITAANSITDEQAQGISFRAEPAQVRLGAFVQVIDPEGTRIGHVASATLVPRPFGPSYATVTIDLA